MAGGLSGCYWEGGMPEAVIRGVKMAVEVVEGRLVVSRADGEPFSLSEGQGVTNMIMNRLDERPIAERAQIKWHRCTSCGGDFDTRELLARHERGVHGKGLPMLDMPGVGGGEQGPTQPAA